MPLVVVIPYLLIEALAFYGVSKLIGTGWALVALIAFFFGGLMLAAVEMRSIARKLQAGREKLGAAAGDLGLVAAGAFGVALPGFVTTIAGLLLIIAPTRVLVRQLLARQLRRRLEEFGGRAFETVSMRASGGASASYGTFVINEDGSPADGSAPSDEDISQWSRTITPEDFGTDTGSNDKQ
ncbi:FxsA family protein [Corynebacterium argentoratense]|uniref:FxsA family protein n=1 Tax=Corynebacterium argentoratense TaxID=42817 RepID=UPI001F283DC8|nr:FxsA family protein [Corynebacterium argentoratense]MCF1764645.1 FxsA family protein [Corynebacterium argentoratense]